MLVIMCGLCRLIDIHVPDLSGDEDVEGCPSFALAVHLNVWFRTGDGPLRWRMRETKEALGFGAARDCRASFVRAAMTGR